MLNGKIKTKIIITLFSLLIFFIMAGTVRAEDEIDVEYPVGTNINGDNIFHNDNIYPGWSETKRIRVGNKSTTDDVNLYFTFDVSGELAEMLKLYVIRVSDESYRIGGEGDRWTLEEADEENLYVDKLDAGDGKQYDIKIKFDENAGNEYQGETADFDIDFTIESEIAEGGTTSETEAEILAEEGREEFTGNPPTVEGVISEEGQLAGEESRCQGWPEWIWVLALIIFSSVTVADAWKKYGKEKYGWKFPMVWTLAAVAFWYFGDTCREFRWFFQYSIIIAFAVHFIYLSLLRKKMEKYKVKKEGE